MAAERWRIGCGNGLFGETVDGAIASANRCSLLATCKVIGVDTSAAWSRCASRRGAPARSPPTRRRRAGATRSPLTKFAPALVDPARGANASSAPNGERLDIGKTLGQLVGVVRIGKLRRQRAAR